MAKARGSGRAGLAKVLAALARHGLLLKQDKALPSVVGLVTGEALASSWWNHPFAHDILALLEALSDRPDAVETKLIGGKVTFVSKTLWPALLGVATSDEAWQHSGLSPAASRLFGAVTRTGEHEASGPTVKELEERLLVRTAQRHSPSGRHVLVLESWARWAKRNAVTALSVAEARTALESATRSLGAPLEALPWLRKARRTTVQG
jgi:hypothetical protein